MPASVQVRSPALAAFAAAAAVFAAAGLAAGEIAPPPTQSPAAAGATPGALANTPILCSEPPGPVALGSAQWNGWGGGVENTRYQPEPAIRATDVSRLALKWAFGYPGAST